MTKLSDLKREWMKDPSFRSEYQTLNDEFALIRTLIEARLRSGLTQAELARRMGTTQSAVARLEAGGVNPSIGMLRRYADATGSRLKVTLEKGG